MEKESCTGNPFIDGIVKIQEELSITFDKVPTAWRYDKRLQFKNGSPNWLAMLILSRVMYKYAGVRVHGMDNPPSYPQELAEWEWHCTYAYLQESFNVSHKQVRTALHALEDGHLVKRVCRRTKYDGRGEKPPYYTLLFLIPNPAEIATLFIGKNKPTNPDAILTGGVLQDISSGVPESEKNHPPKSVDKGGGVLTGVRSGVPKGSLNIEIRNKNIQTADAVLSQSSLRSDCDSAGIVGNCKPKINEGAFAKALAEVVDVSGETDYSLDENNADDSVKTELTYTPIQEKKKAKHKKIKHVPTPVPAAPSHRKMVSILAEVCCMDLKISGGKVGAFAKRLLQADYTPEDIERWYSDDGWWYQADWRGNKGQIPTLEAIYDSIGKAKAGVMPKAPIKVQPERNGFSRQLQKDMEMYPELFAADGTYTG